MLATGSVRRNGVARNFSASSSPDSSDDALKLRTNNASTSNNRRKPIRSIKARLFALGGGVGGGNGTEVSPVVWAVLGIGVFMCLLDVVHLFRYVAQHETASLQLQPPVTEPVVPAVLPVVEMKESDEDDGAKVPSDGDDHANVDPKKLSIFDHPVQFNPVPAAAAVVSAASPITTTKNVSQAVVGDKGPLLDLLRDARVTVTQGVIERLPTWEEVAALYGDKPVVYGLEQCERFQKENGDPADHFVSTAGAFNTGTNLMAELLIHNCHMPARMAKYGHKNHGVRWQVLWGKHTPVGDEEFRRHHRVYNDTMDAKDIFATVTVRDPYKWMQSMCRHRYAAKWNHDDSHCPSLIPNDADKAKHPSLADKEVIPVMVRYKEFDKHHDSLVAFWNDWYNEYVNAPFPRLIVRFEDVIFHPKEITRIACECAGGQLNEGPFRYEVESAKKGKAHGKEKTSYVDSLIKYGSENGRYDGFEPADLEYVRKQLDPRLMEIFGYKYPSAENPTDLSTGR